MLVPDNKPALADYPANLIPLCTGLEALETAAVVLDEAAQVVYITTSASRLLELSASQVDGQKWQTLWHSLCPTAPPLTATAQRLTLNRTKGAIPVRVWQRPLAGAGTGYTLISLEDLSAEDQRERETLQIFHDLQTQADDLFALYQISQFLNATQELDQLCSTLLRELVRITGADFACLYLITPPATLQPKVWHGLDVTPPPQPDSEAALAWFQSGLLEYEVLRLPLLAEEQLVGLALLACREGPGRELRFLQTVAHEMGTALRAMAGRQALIAQEQKLEAIVTGTTDAIIQVGLDRRINDFNPAAVRLTGYPVADALHQPCAKILGCAGDYGCGGTCLFGKVLDSGEPIPYIELVVAGPEGPRHVAASVAALTLNNTNDTKLDSEGNQGAVGILRDISKQKQIEQMKTDFTAMVSHELRTPLALLRGYSDTLLHLALSPQEQADCMKGIATTITQLERLVAQILDVSRIEAGRIELDCELLQLDQVIKQAILDLPYPDQRSRIQSDLPFELPLLYGDAGRLEQLITNLLENALKYSPARGQVFIRAEQVGPEILVEVLDEGIGIPPQEQDTLFNKFQRASNARHLQLPGTGLGLFICRSLVEAHGGRIRLANRPGPGVCVTFWIPIARKEG